MNFLDFIKVILMTSFGLLISLCLVPVLFPIFAVFSIITGFVIILIKIRYGNSAYKANGTDVLSGKETEDSYPIINVAFRFTGKMDPSQFRERILHAATNAYDEYGNRRYERLMLLYKRRFGYYIWQKNNNFNIDQHIRVITDDDLGNYKKDKETDNTWKSVITAILNKFGGERVQEDIPQWQLLLYKENSERYIAVFRFHHCIADGIYVSRMLVEEFLDSPAKLFHNYYPPTAFAKIILKLWSFYPFGLWKILKNNDKNVLHGPKLSGEKKYFVSKAISMDLLRDLRIETGMSLHAILFSCLSVSISSHFKRRNSETKEVTALIPIPMQDLSKPIELKNRYAVVSLKIPTSPSPSPSSGDRKSFPGADIPSLSPLNRLDAINATLLEAKKDPTFISVHSLITTFCSFLPAKVAESLLSTKGCSIAFSNLPGPQETIYFKKDKIDEVMFWIPDRSPMGVGLSILSYDNHLRAGYSVDTALLRDDEEGELLIKDFENEIDNLLQSLRTERELLYTLKQENEKLLGNLP